MTQATMFNLGPTVDPLDGFEAWWALYPRNPKHGGGRKYGKDKCKHYWRHYKLYEKKDQIMAAMREDIRCIEKGHFAMSPGSNDRMYSFPAAPTWINPNADKGARWDRDIEPEKPKPVRVEAPPVVVNPVTKEERRRGLALMKKALQNGTGVTRADVIDPDGTVAGPGRAGVREGSVSQTKRN